MLLLWWEINLSWFGVDRQPVQFELITRQLLANQLISPRKKTYINMLRHKLWVQENYVVA